MSVVVERLVEDGAVVLALGILVEVKLDQIARREGLARHGVTAELLQIWHDIHEVEDDPVGGTHGSLKGAEGNGAAVKRQRLVRKVPNILLTAPVMLPLCLCDVKLRAQRRHETVVVVVVGLHVRALWLPRGAQHLIL